MSATDWRKSGRDAAHEDATREDAAPCTTLDDARVRCAAWLEDVEGADVEAAAEGYLAGWAAHLRDAAENAAPLDLDAIEARILAAPSCDCGRPSTQWCADSECEAESCDGHARQTGALGHEHRWTRYPIATEDAAALLAEASRLRALHGAAAQAYDDLVALAWRAATGNTHEGPASVDEMLAALGALRSSHRECSEALLTMTRRALNAERLIDATEGTEREEELARQIRAEADARVRDLTAKLDAAAQARNEERVALAVGFGAAIAAARRAGAEAMREACAKQAEHEGTWDIAAALRALPLPEGDDAGSRTAAYRAGAKAMREACVDALNAMAHAEGVDAERFRLTRNEDSAAEHHHKRAALLEARVTLLGLPLPEVTP